MKFHNLAAATFATAFLSTACNAPPSQKTTTVLDVSAKNSFSPPKTYATQNLKDLFEGHNKKDLYFATHAWDVKVEYIADKNAFTFDLITSRGELLKNFIADDPAIKARFDQAIDYDALVVVCGGSFDLPSNDCDSTGNISRNSENAHQDAVALIQAAEATFQKMDRASTDPALARMSAEKCVQCHSGGVRDIQTLDSAPRR